VGCRRLTPRRLRGHEGKVVRGDRILSCSETQETSGTLREPEGRPGVGGISRDPAWVGHVEVLLGTYDRAVVSMR